MGSRANHRRRLALAAATLVGLAIGLVVSPAGLLMLSPAIALVVLVALDAFPSDELITRLRRRLRRPRRVAPLAERPYRPRPRPSRVGAVLPFALAVRPPPTTALTTLG